MHKPECPDVADKMVNILNSFIHDAVKEYNSYPLATLSWMMYTGMALAKYWDLEWDVYSKVDDMYVYLRDKRGYDAMDDYIMDEVLCLKGEDKIKLQNLVMNCASGANDMLIHSGVESGTREAFELFVSCLRQKRKDLPYSKRRNSSGMGKSCKRLRRIQNHKPDYKTLKGTFAGNSGRRRRGGG